MILCPTPLTTAHSMGMAGDGEKEKGERTPKFAILKATAARMDGMEQDEVIQWRREQGREKVVQTTGTG